MRQRLLYASIIACLVSGGGGLARAADGDLVPIVGGLPGDGGLATSAQIRFPGATLVDEVTGDLYIADVNNYCVWRVDPLDGTIHLFAGTAMLFGDSGDGGPATDALLGQPTALAQDSAGNVYIVDSAFSRVRVVELATGDIFTFAGTGEATGSIDGEGGDPTDDLGEGGPSDAASLSSPTSVSIDFDDNVYIMDAGNFRVREVDALTGDIATVVGTGEQTLAGADPGNGGPAVDATLSTVGNAFVLPDGQIYIADTFNYQVRHVDLLGDIDVVAGSGVARDSIDGPGGNPDDDLGDTKVATNASFQTVVWIQVTPNGDFFITDSQDERVRFVNHQGHHISTVAGTGNFGISADGAAGSATDLAFPASAIVDPDGNLLISDQYSHRIRQMPAAGGNVATVAGRLPGDGGDALDAMLNVPVAVTYDQVTGDMYIVDRNHFRIRAVDSTGTIVTVAGTGFSGVVQTEDPGDIGDGGQSVDAIIWNPLDVAVDQDTGDIYIAEPAINRIRRIEFATGIITTYAGNGLFTNEDPLSPGDPLDPSLPFVALGDEGPAADASLSVPLGITVCLSTLIIADTGNSRIRGVNLASGVIFTIAGNGLFGDAGDGADALDASLYFPDRIDCDAQGNLFFSEESHVVRRVNFESNVIDRYAGTYNLGFSGDEGPAADAELFYPFSVKAGPDGSLYIADSGNLRIRWIDPGQTIHTIAGNGTDGVPGAAGAPALDQALDFPGAIALDPAGNLDVVNDHRVFVLAGSAKPIPDAGVPGADAGAAIDAAAVIDAAVATVDAGPIDAAVVVLIDAAPAADAGPPVDAGPTPDAAPPSPDAMVVAQIDAAPPPDAARPDAFVPVRPDAQVATPDAQVVEPPDAAPIAMPDARPVGRPDAGPKKGEASGCSCNVGERGSSPARAPAAGILLAGLALVIRRRRRND